MAVGIVSAGALLTAFYCFWRRHRKVRRRREWMSSIRRPLPNPTDPFEDPRPSPPPMQALYPDRPLVTVEWETKRHTLVEDESPQPLNPHGTSNGVRFTGDQRPPSQELGLALTTSIPDARTTSQISLPQSSPSIYTATLPPDVDDDPTFDWEEAPVPILPIAVIPPPRPPRSLLRDRSLTRKSVDYTGYPLTPPSSESSHSASASKPASPSLERQGSLPRRRPSESYEDILNRRTLLDVG